MLYTCYEVIIMIGNKRPGSWLSALPTIGDGRRIQRRRFLDHRQSPRVLVTSLKSAWYCDEACNQEM